MKKFFNILLSDSNKVSTKRFIGLICLIMFVAYGIMGLINPFNEYFWIFYVSLCTITIWIAFKFMSAEKVLKYDVIGKLSKFSPITESVYEAIRTEDQIDVAIQPDMADEKTTQLSPNEKKLLGLNDKNNKPD
jgi:hypothetical protein